MHKLVIFLQNIMRKKSLHLEEKGQSNKGDVSQNKNEDEITSKVKILLSTYM